MPQLPEWTPTMELRWHCPNPQALNSGSGMWVGNEYAKALGYYGASEQSFSGAWKLQQKWTSTKTLGAIEWRDIPYHTFY